MCLFWIDAVLHIFGFVKKKSSKNATKFELIQNLNFDIIMCSMNNAFGRTSNTKSAKTFLILFHWKTCHLAILLLLFWVVTCQKKRRRKWKVWIKRDDAITNKKKAKIMSFGRNMFRSMSTLRQQFSIWVCQVEARREEGEGEEACAMRDTKSKMTGHFRSINNRSSLRRSSANRKQTEWIGNELTTDWRSDIWIGRRSK